MRTTRLEDLKLLLVSGSQGVRRVLASRVQMPPRNTGKTCNKRPETKLIVSLAVHRQNDLHVKCRRNEWTI